MNVEPWIITLAVGVLSALFGGGGVFGVMTAYMNYKLKDRDQAHTHCLKMIDKMAKRIEVLEARIETLEREQAGG